MQPVNIITDYDYNARICEVKPNMNAKNSPTLDQPTPQPIARSQVSTDSDGEFLSELEQTLKEATFPNSDLVIPKDTQLRPQATLNSNDHATVTPNSYKSQTDPNLDEGTTSASALPLVLSSKMHHILSTMGIKFETLLTTIVLLTLISTIVSGIAIFYLLDSTEKIFRFNLDLQLLNIKATETITRIDVMKQALLTTQRQIQALGQPQQTNPANPPVAPGAETTHRPNRHNPHPR
ncbi:hypothetical protein TI04_11050 [Achromatium sp. WMS2]|nr:hypothetical protein TI04_11050 [Achromatium sp. WMS2]